VLISEANPLKAYFKGIYQAIFLLRTPFENKIGQILSKVLEK
jgi:hypothetical protein